MIYRITYEGKGKDRIKLAHPVKDRDTLMALRNSKKNLDLLEKFHEGDSKAKGKLLQLAYNLGYVDGPLAGCQSIGSFFFDDVDCYNEEQAKELMESILAKKDEIGLVMLERSASGGYHLVCKRIPGTTILENQVRVSLILKVEMDTSAHDLQRVVYTTSGSSDDLIYLDDALFEEPMTPEECEKEYELLKQREAQGQEDVPPGAKKANKHYKPWEDESGSLVQRFSSQNPISDVEHDADAMYNGYSFKEIIDKYWELFNDGKVPVEGDRNALTFELALTLRSICGYKIEKMLAVIPNYWNKKDDPEEVRQENIKEWQQTIENALKEPRKGMPLRLKQILTALKSTSAIKACGGSLTSPPPLSSTTDQATDEECATAV